MDAQEMYEKICDKIDRLIEKLDTKLTDIDKKVQNHEVRIVVLEQKAPDKSDWKAQIITLLVKAVVVASISIASLVGAGSLLKGIFGS